MRHFVNHTAVATILFVIPKSFSTYDVLDCKPYGNLLVRNTNERRPFVLIFRVLESRQHIRLVESCPNEVPDCLKTADISSGSPEPSVILSYYCSLHDSAVIGTMI